MLNIITEGKNLNFEQAYELFNLILNESEVKIAAYLAAMQAKNYTFEEIAGLAKAMRDKALKVDFGDVADTCGTGGDNFSTINVSTVSSIILSCFTKVAKHGNFSITSKSGSADVLKTLGIEIEMTPERAKHCIKETNFTFLLAPNYHPALRKIMPVRKMLGIKTIFNILGPLTNPANPTYQIVGVYSAELVEKIGNALNMLGVRRALVVHGNGLDEINPHDETLVAEVNNDVEIYKITPEDFGIRRTRIIPCRGANESAERILKVFSGEMNGDANFILTNASAALYACKMASDFREGFEIAKNVVLEGEAMKKIREVKNASKET
ncbi:anthranilate phosphoribosyltransferase [Archaeoglobales archaeon]|nr:MAG: anthranilate phosphoribosyltransferase [Archaeoglobales archaeon]